MTSPGAPAQDSQVQDAWVALLKGPTPETRPAPGMSPFVHPGWSEETGSLNRNRGLTRRGRSSSRLTRRSTFKKEQSLHVLLLEDSRARQGVADTLATRMEGALADERLCDVALVGKDGMAVRASSFLLASHSEVFARLFYGPGRAGVATPVAEPGSGPGASDAGWDASAHRAALDDAAGTDAKTLPTYTVKLAFATWDAIDVAVKFFVRRSLPLGLEQEATEFKVRTLCQIHLLGRLCDVDILVEAVYNKARVLMNKRPPLACAAFDECRQCLALLSPTQRLSSRVDALKDYAFDYMRDMPEETLLAQGTPFLTGASIEAIICDQEMDVDETTMFNILSSWVKQDEGNVEVGKRLVSNIQLRYMTPDHLKYVVKNCGFVDAADVNAALKEIEEALANESPDNKEHVLVTGAGRQGVDGIYVRMEGDIGAGQDDFMFVKEGSYDDGYGTDLTLFRLRSTWGISLSADSSNLLYSCEAPEGAILPRPPACGWQAVSGQDPSPTCAWSCKKPERPKLYVAPDIGSKGVLLGTDGLDHAEGKDTKRTLGSMMSLPVDEGHENKDYHHTLSIQEDALAILRVPVENEGARERQRKKIIQRMSV